VHRLSLGTRKKGLALEKKGNPGRDFYKMVVPSPLNSVYMGLGKYHCDKAGGKTLELKNLLE